MAKKIMTATLNDTYESLRNLESTAYIHMEANKKKLARLEKEVERQQKAQSSLFVALLLAVAVSLVSVSMALKLMGDVASLEKQIDHINSRVTAVTAEVRGIGG